MQKLDRKGRYTLYGVYEECKDDMNSRLLEIRKGETKSKEISYRVFSKVIRRYFQILFGMLIDGYTVPLLNKFGTLEVVKTKCIRYTPKKYFFKRKEDGSVKVENISLKTRLGYWYFVFWNSPKNLRQYRFNINLKYKIEYMKKVSEGFDYIDLSLDKYGLNASNTYIHQIK